MVMGATLAADLFPHDSAPNLSDRCRLSSVVPAHLSLAPGPRQVSVEMRAIRVPHTTGLALYGSRVDPMRTSKYAHDICANQTGEFIIPGVGPLSTINSFSFTWLGIVQPLCTIFFSGSVVIVEPCIAERWTPVVYY